jgi:NADPH:quinone reductase-like Zn-dependent oxidoreductase
MQTIVLDQPGRLTLTETPPPAGPGPGEAIVRVHRIGVCGTDLHAFKGEQPFFSYPRILGHELGVEVLALGPGGDPAGRIAVGDRCAVEPYLNCGVCVACRRGKTNCCVALQTLGVHTNGGMREAIALPLGPRPRCRTSNWPWWRCWGSARTRSVGRRWSRGNGRWWSARDRSASPRWSLPGMPGHA